MRRRDDIGILMISLALGLVLVSWPTATTLRAAYAARRVTSEASANISTLETADLQKEIRAAQDYNAALLEGTLEMSVASGEVKPYNEQLALFGNGLLGSIEIQAANIHLPIYHGTGDSTLTAGVGHLEGSSLPIGGIGTNCVLMGHTGLTESRMLDNLSNVSAGDEIILHAITGDLTYEVDSAQVVEPNDVSGLRPLTGKDMITLITCTPIGINSHRLVVKATRASRGSVPHAGNANEDVIQPPSNVSWQDLAVLALGSMICLIVSVRLSRALARRIVRRPERARRAS